MRKITIYKLLTVINFLVFGAVLVTTHFVGNNFSNMWFPSLMFAVSMSLFIKYAVFKSGNTLWFALVLFGIAMYYTASVLIKLDPRLWPNYAVIPSLVSLMLAICGKSLWQMCLFVGLLFLSAPLYLISFSLISVWLFVVIYVASVVLGAVAINFIFNLWRGVYGKI